MAELMKPRSPDWVEGEQTEGELVPDADPRRWRFVCRCCGQTFSLLYQTLPEPVLCSSCGPLIQRERTRLAVARWVNEHG